MLKNPLFFNLYYATSRPPWFLNRMAGAKMELSISLLAVFRQSESLFFVQSYLSYIIFITFRRLPYCTS